MKSTVEKINIVEVQDLLDLIYKLQGGYADNFTWEEVYMLFEKIFNYYAFSVNTMDGSKDKEFLFRGRITSDNINNIEQLIYNKNVTRYGRCNIPDQSIFYSSNSLDTVLNELSPERDDTVYVCLSKIKDNASLNIVSIGEIDYYRRYRKGIYSTEVVKDLVEENKRTNGHQGAFILNFLDAYFAELFLRNASKFNEYKITSAISNFIFNKDPRYHGLLYLSVQHRGGFNIALTSKAFDDNLEVFECYKLKIKGKYGFGIFIYDIINQSDSIDEEGNIMWRFRD